MKSKIPKVSQKRKVKGKKNGERTYKTEDKLQEHSDHRRKTEKSTMTKNHEKLKTNHDKAFLKPAAFIHFA